MIVPGPVDRLPVFPTAAEVGPRCRHFGMCGGCQLQHLTQRTQLDWKAESIRNRLMDAQIAAPPIKLHAAAEYEYRNRIRLRIQEGLLGYSLRASNDFLPVNECPIAAPLLWRTAETLRHLTRGTNQWPACSSEVELITNSEESGLQLLLHVVATLSTLDRGAPKQFRALCEALHAVVPQLTGAGLLVQGAPLSGPRRMQERQRIEVAQWGTPCLEHNVRGVHHSVSRGAFFQVNRFLTEQMVDLVLGQRSGRLAWDLFAGAGLFSVPLAHRFRQVIAVEVGQPAANDLREALRRVGGSHQAIIKQTDEFLKRPVSTVPDLIVLDPPRSGLGLGVAKRMADIGSPELVYVSCDAATFARDAKTLVHSRYTLTDLHLVDVFPQTQHTETIAVFRRN